MSVRNISDEDPNYEEVKHLLTTPAAKYYKVKRRSDPASDMACYKVKLAEADALDIVRCQVTAVRALDDCRYVALFDEDMAFDQEKLIVHLYVDYSFKPECTLAQFIQASKSSIKKEMVAVIMNTLAKALVDCHAKGVYHQHVRPSNILLAKKPWGEFTLLVAYLTNFGIRQIMEVASFSSPSSEESPKDYIMSSSQCYMAPECLDPSNPTFSAKSDVFSLGCVMYELCCRKKAYQNTERVEVSEMPPAQRNIYGNSLSPMPSQLVQLEPDKRPDIQTFSNTMQAYCESRTVKYKNKQAWIGTGIQIVGAVVGAQHPVQAGLINAATKIAVAKVMAPVSSAPQSSVASPSAVPSSTPPAQAEPQKLLGAPVPSGQEPALTREISQPEPPVSVQAPQAPPPSSQIGLQELLQALLGQAQQPSQPNAQEHPQLQGLSVSLSPEEQALGHEFLQVLLRKKSQAQPQTQPGGQASPGLALSQALTSVPSPTPQQRQSVLHKLPELPPIYQETPSVAFQSQPQTQVGPESYHQQSQAAAQPPTAAQQQAFQMALHAQQAQWQNFQTLMQAQNQNAQTMAAMNANNFHTMHNINSMYQNQHQQQFAQNQQTQAINDANRHLYAQAWGQAIQGNDVIVWPAGQPNPSFYGGV